MSQTPDKSEKSPQNGPSVLDVIFLPKSPLDEILMAGEPLQVKCNICDAITIQGYYYIDVESLSIVTPEIAEAMMKLRRRLIFCTHCGTYRITS